MPPINKINEFCRDHNHNSIISSILLSYYYTEINTLKNDYKNSEKQDPSDQVIQGFSNTLLSNNNLAAQARIAYGILDDHINSQIDTINKGSMLKEFGANVLASIVGSFLFVLLSVGIYIVFQNQFENFVRSVNTNSEQNQTDN